MTAALLLDYCAGAGGGNDKVQVCRSHSNFDIQDTTAAAARGPAGARLAGLAAAVRRDR